jgi:hypothetical protein
VSRAITDADPIVSRITLGRSDEGNQFGMFLQVYADGTVIDSEGVHTLGRDAIRGIVETLQTGDLYRARGHCGGPPTDFIEQVQVIVYERSLGRLRAYALSLSGNSQGCEPAVRRLQSALDNLQTKLNRKAPSGTPLAPAADPGQHLPAQPAGPTIPLIRENEISGRE